MWRLYGGGFLVAFLQLAVVYYSAAILLHYIVPSIAPVRSVQRGTRVPGQVTREAMYSLGPIAMKAAMWTIVEKLHANGYSLLYDEPLFTSLSSFAYAVFTIIALDYVHDTWFYWTHRLLHWGPLYKRVHYVHHRSTVPTAFTGYSFHVVEALIVFANEVLICWILPIHVGLHRVYHMFTTIIHNGGHAGYEMAPYTPSIEACIALLANALVVKSPVPTKALNTVQHHDMHHRHPKVHFSLYMTHWDRFMGTEHPEYERAVEQHFVFPTSGRTA